MEKKWCGHWINDKNCYGQQVWRFKETEGLKTWDDYTPNFCPICGAKRPEPEKKTLAERLYNSYNWERVAQTAIAWAVEVVEEYFKDEAAYLTTMRNELIARLKEGE